MTTIAEEILDFLGTGVEPLNVHDTRVPARDTDAGQVIEVPTPFVVFRPAPGTPTARRAGISIAAETYTFEIVHAGVTREQAEAARDRARARLQDQRPQHTGTRNNPIHRTETTGIDEDPVYHAPGGVRLLFGVDTYAVVL